MDLNPGFVASGSDSDAIRRPESDSREIKILTSMMLGEGSCASQLLKYAKQINNEQINFKESCKCTSTVFDVM